MNDAPIKVVVVPVTPLQQNATLIYCTRTMRGAFTDPGDETDKLEAVAAQAGVTIEKILITHGHIDHCGRAGALADKLGVPIEGPHEADRYWIARLDEDGRRYGVNGAPFEPSRWLNDGDQVTVGEAVLDVIHCPGHTPGHVIFHHAPSRFAIVGDVLFRGSVGRWDFPLGDFDALVDSITRKLWPLGDDTVFLPGHGQASSFGEERRSNPVVGDRAVAERAG